MNLLAVVRIECSLHMLSRQSPLGTMKFFKKSPSSMEWNCKAWARRGEWASVKVWFRQSENLGNKRLTLISITYYVLVLFWFLKSLCVSIRGQLVAAGYLLPFHHVGSRDEWVSWGALYGTFREGILVCHSFLSECLKCCSICFCLVISDYWNSLSRPEQGIHHVSWGANTHLLPYVAVSDFL